MTGNAIGAPSGAEPKVVRVPRASMCSNHAKFCQWHVDWDDAACTCGYVMSVPSDIDHLGGPARKVSGPTILLGDGSYFDYTSPETSEMTIDDFAWGLACRGRFSGQCRLRVANDHPRIFYSVAEHCVRGAIEMLKQGRTPYEAYCFLMHEGGEPVCGDDPGPMKPLCPDKKALEKRCEAAAHAQFGVVLADPAFMKEWDLRMLATEQRDLMPQSGTDKWRNAEDHPRDLPAPFDFIIGQCMDPADAAARFLSVYYMLRQSMTLEQMTLSVK